ncbi:GLIPR2 [Branchiostoma lanceolatum]|uniref:GLIPR2 protein n=2 Tax=Branchiostoma lanceolatum TaxID=7740 RepID=A0A8K0EDP9_BRALA|nr:GLIPR2 [Branchiostoma lanceolatum]
MKTSLVIVLAVVLLAFAVEANGLEICPYGVSEENSVTPCRDALPEGACGVFQGDVKSFTPKCLWRMNRYRHLHNAPALRWDHALATSAEKWAENLARNNEITDTGSGDSENELFHFPIVTCQAAVNTWYSEAACYHKDSPGPNFQNIAHFSQLVWKSSRRVGCGVSGRYMCCNYSPHGNILTDDAFQRNVEIPNGWTLPAGLTPPSKCGRKFKPPPQSNVIGQRLGIRFDDVINNLF